MYEIIIILRRDNMKRKISAFFLSLTIIFTSSISYGLNSGVMEKVNSRSILSMDETNTFEKLFTLSELNVYEKDGVYMIPVRKVLEKLDYEVSWNNNLKQVDIVKDMDVYTLKNGEYYYFKGKEPIKLSTAPETKDGITYVPLEFFSTVLGQQVIVTGPNLGLYKTEINVVEKESLDMLGYIKSINVAADNKTILTSIDNEKSEMPIGQLSLHVFDDTEILNSDEEKINFKALKVGDEIEFITPRYMTMSLPAQTTAKKIVKKEFLEIEKKDYEKDEKHLSYPVLTYKGDKAVESLFNQRVDEYLNELKEDDMFYDLKLDYNISLLNKERISLIFNGKFTYMGQERDSIKVLNMDLTNGEEIVYENYFKTDQESKEKLEKLIRSEVKKTYGKDFEAEGIFLYFTEDTTVLYYYELDDSAVTPIEIYLTNDKIKELIK